MHEICLARQPIFDTNMNVVAYELLFRSLKPEQPASDASRGDSATTQVLNNAFSELGLGQVTAGHPAFINCTRNWLLNATLSSLPREQVVIEILEDIVIDEAVIQAVAQLDQAGYRIALDDFVFSEEWIPLIEHADIIKYDLRTTSWVDLKDNMAALKKYPLKFLAEKVETYEEFNQCVAMGFDYFQGYFLCKPKLLTGKKIPANRTVLLQLIQKLNSPGITMEGIMAVINQDARLGYKLLRIVNSALYGLPRKIDNIKDTLVFLGLDKIKQMTQLLLLGMQENTPHELLVTSLLRAKMMEILAAELKRSHADRYFTVGLFSTLDALLDEPMGSLLKTVALSDEISLALTEQEGEMGHFLKSILSYEKGEWDAAITYPGLDLALLNRTYWTAIPWSIEASGMIQVDNKNRRA